MKEYLAYIDETGDPDFNSSSSRSFLVGAIILDKDQFLILTEKVNQIKIKYDLDEFKSSKKITTKLRYNIFCELIDLDFKLITIWIEKQKLQGNWFKFRDKFYKYVQRRLNHEIFRLFENIQVRIDKFGSDKYQKSFEKYLYKSLQEELFEPKIEITSHKYETFIQISDFISGSINWLLVHDPIREQKIWDLILPKWISRISIPDNKKLVDPSLFEQSDDFFDVCIKEADRYLEKNKKEEETAKYKTLEYLFYSSFESPESFIYTSEILNWLEQVNLKLSEEQFRNEVIAALRDEGLIIVGTRKGLKIPTQNDDLIEYINFSTHLALPILRRLKKALIFVETKLNSNKYTEAFDSELKEILDKVNA